MVHTRAGQATLLAHMSAQRVRSTPHGNAGKDETRRERNNTAPLPSYTGADGTGGKGLLTLNAWLYDDGLKIRLKHLGSHTWAGTYAVIASLSRRPSPSMSALVK
jgi:hypothetical protein